MEQNTTPIPQIKIQGQKEPLLSVTHDETKLGTATPDVSNSPVNIERVFGMPHMVTAIPTWSPKTFNDSFAFNTTTATMYYYDFVNKAWKTIGTSGSILAGNGTMTAGILDVTHAGITATSRCVATRSGSADSSAFPQIATGYQSGTTMRIFEGSFSKAWSIDYIIYY